MPPASAHPRRCAVYTRKSSEEGLEQGFNSLDAQREACEAYIRSQVGEGWQLIGTHFDDGGYSGGTMERPALQQLLAAIGERKVDTVVVYKVDRLTRSLADFSKIVETFDAAGVAFVSVTQQFNTTTSMGRLTLNMLLSFAQFEREVTGERIRDKIAASKQKGMWMGGFVPLGYEPDGRTLTINEVEAETVRTVYRLFLEIGNVRRVKEEADRLGIRTKVRTSAAGVMHGGRPLSRGYIYKLLNNPLYVGRIVHKENSYDGQHPPLIDVETWNAVQARLAANTYERRSGSNTKERSLLAGKLFDETGTPLTPSHAVKSGRRYRYYVSRSLISGAGKRSASQGQDGWRLPAREIERTVERAVTGLLADRSMLVDKLRDAGLEVERIPPLLDAVDLWKGTSLDLVERVELGNGQLDISLNLLVIDGITAPTVRHVVAAQIKRRGVEMRLVVDGPGAGPGTSSPDPALIKAVARAHRWFDDIATGRARSIAEIAKSEGFNKRYVGRLLPLAFLAPEIIESIVAGTQPVDLTAEALTRYSDLSPSWAAQKVQLGFV